MEEFYKRKNSKDGMRSDCKKCIRDHDRQYYQNNKERIKEQRKQYYRDNKEYINEYSRQYHQNNIDTSHTRDRQYYRDNKERINERTRQYHQNNKEQIKEQRKQHYRDNKERINEQKKQHYRDNKEYINERNRQYRHKLPGAVYSITNTINGNVYIGQSKKYPRRKANHLSELCRNKHNNPRLQSDYNKHGKEVFEFKVIEDLPSDTDRQILLEKEENIIRQYLVEGKTLYNKLN